MFSLTFLFSILFVLIACGLKPVPPPEGRFCDTWHKPVDCVELDFRKGVANLGQGSVPLQMKSVVIYQIASDNKQTILVEVLHEHRVRITFPGAEPRLYLKIKDKDDRKRRWEKAKEEWNEFFK
ncbi:LIC12806 family lipoprotein [Leptospira tipperaryensis]